MEDILHPNHNRGIKKRGHVIKDSKWVSIKWLKCPGQGCSFRVASTQIHQILKNKMKTNKTYQGMIRAKIVPRNGGVGTLLIWLLSLPWRSRGHPSGSHWKGRGRLCLGFCSGYSRGPHADMLWAPCQLWAFPSDLYKTCFATHLMDGRTETGILDRLKVTA